MTDRCNAVSPGWTSCQREEGHDGLHRGETAAGAVAQWPDDAVSSNDVQRKVGDDGE